MSDSTVYLGLGVGLALALLAAALFVVAGVVFFVWLLRRLRSDLEADLANLEKIGASMELARVDGIEPHEAIGASRSPAERDLIDPGGRFHFLQDRSGQAVSWVLQGSGRSRYLQARRGHAVSWVLRGEREGARVTLCRHTGNAGSDESTQQTVAAFAASDLALPAFALSRADTETRYFLTLTGTKHFPLPGTSDGDSKYLLRGPDEEAIRRLFAPPLADFLHQRDLWNVDGRGQHLLVYREEHVVEPHELPAFLAQALEVLRAFRVASAQVDAQRP